MSAAHAPGPVSYQFADGYCGEIIAANGEVVCAFIDEPSEADARRLVACWNACEGLSTEALERLGTIDRTRVERDVLHAQARNQRDILLNAAIEFRRSVWTGDHTAKPVTEALADLDRAIVNAGGVVPV